MSALTERLTGLKPKSPLCTVGRILEKLDVDDRELLIECLADPQFSHRQIHEAIQPDFPVTRDYVTKHRRKKCVCYNPTERTA